MRWVGLLLIVVSGAACDDGRPPAGGPSRMGASRDVGNASTGGRALPAGGNLAVAVTASPALARATPNESSSARPRGQEPPQSEPKDGAGESMDDVEDAVPITDRSGAAAPVSEPERFEGIEVELQE